MASKDSKTAPNSYKLSLSSFVERAAFLAAGGRGVRPKQECDDSNVHGAREDDIQEMTNERLELGSIAKSQKKLDGVVASPPSTQSDHQQIQKEDTSRTTLPLEGEQCVEVINPQISRQEEHQRHVAELKSLQREMNSWYDARYEATVEGKGLLAAKSKELEASVDYYMKQELFFEAELQRLRHSGEIISHSNKEKDKQLRQLQEDFHRAEFRHAIEITELKKNLSDVQEKSKAELSFKESQWAAIVSNLEEHIEKVEEEHQSQHQRLQSRLEQEYEVDLQRLKSVIDALKREHQVELQQLQLGLEQEHQSDQQQLESVLNTLRVDHQSELQSSKSQLLNEMSQLSFEKDHRIVSLQSELSAKTNELAVLSDMIKTQRSDESRNLQAKFQKEIEAYRVALMARDNFTPLTDMVITSKFQDLAHEIEQLARMDWKAYPETDIVLLRSLAANTRLLQKQLLQHVIWAALYQFLLASPFRMFGAEGKTLEDGWSQISKVETDEINVWPPVSIETERWRYINVQECRSALIHPAASQSDPRMTLKEGYSTTIDKLKQHLYETLECTIGLDENGKQSIAKISKKASKMWLEFGMERCRLLVIMKNVKLETAKDQLRRAQAGEPLKLIPCPQLRRYGDSMGQDLEVHSTVHGCEGSTVTVTKMERSQ